MIGAHLSFSKDQQNKIFRMGKEKRANLIDKLFFGVAERKVKLTGEVKPPSFKPLLIKTVYLDGLNQNLFMDAFFDIRVATLFVATITAKELATPSRDDIALNYTW